MKKTISRLLALGLALSLALIPASALELDEAKELLALHYVDGVPPEVLELDSLDDILEAIGDPYTFYMTPEQYDAFNRSVNGQTVVGIGATVENAFTGGYRIMSVLPNSPALEAGLKAGDILVAVDGRELTAETDPRTYIVGEEGTGVTITILREGRRMDLTLTRRAVTIPIVTYEMKDGTAYIDCISFGESTAETFKKALTELEDQTAVWIVDLRSNPGGDSSATALSASHFTGGHIMLYFRDGAGNYRYTYTLPGYPDLTDKPVIILTSANSASGSELFAGDIRSYGAGIALGQRTFGKGTAQRVLDGSNCEYMKDGEALKITVYRFFAPDGATNHITGVLPTLLISPENTEKAAFLLATGYGPSGDLPLFLKIDLAGQTFVVNLYEATGADSLAAFTELLEALPPSADLSLGEGTLHSKDGTPVKWSPITRDQLAQNTLNLTNFTPRTLPDATDSPYAREIDTLTTYRILNGYDDGLFHPNDPVTRAQFCAMIASALNLPDGTSAKFSDVEEGAWYAGAVNAMADMGFVSGRGDGLFCPGQAITYQEMTAVLSRVAAWVSMDGYELDRQELTLEEWGEYYDFAAWAQVPARNLSELGVLVDGLSPADPGTREAAAAMLCRLMESIHLIWN